MNTGSTRPGGGAQSSPPLGRRDLLTRLLRARPLLLAALLFLAGCLLQYALELPLRAACIALALPPLAAVCLRRRRDWMLAVLVLALIPAGMLRFGVAWNASSPLPARKGAELRGRICEMPEYRPDAQRTVCTLDELRVNGTPCGGKLLLYLRGDDARLRAVRLGQEVCATANIWQTDEATNPGQFNYANYRRARGLRAYATAEIEGAEFADAPARLSDRIERLRAALGERVDRLFPNNAPLARALVLGDRSELSEEDRQSYAQAGAAHLLAISGMHLSILAWLISLLLGRFLRRDAAFGITLGLLCAYALLTGFAHSITRALIMYALFGLGPALGRRSDGITRLGAALLLHLLIRPAALLDTGFVLSYGATAGILLLARPLGRLPLLRRALDGPANFRSPGGRALRWIASMVAMSLAAQIAILPAVVNAYGSQPVWALAANLIAAPLTMLAYILALIGMLPGLAPAAAAADWLLGLLTKLVTGIAALPLSSVRVARLPLWLTALCVAACVAASDLSRLPARIRRWLPFAVILAIPVANLCAWCTTLGVSAVFLDAGQADCAVLRCQGRVYLIDAGDRYSPAADYLSAMNYAPEAVFLTHPHADHAFGLAGMLEVCTPKRIYVSANWSRFEIDPELQAALDEARDRGAELVSLSAGDAIPLSEDVNLSVLSPQAGISADSANEDSLILRVEYGDTRALFLADAPASVAEGLVGDIDLLKVAHHGAKDGTSAALLAEATPSAAVISVGRDNGYGHPSALTLELLDAAGAKVWRTDRSGAITCRMHSDGTLELRGYLPLEVGDGLE